MQYVGKEVEQKMGAGELLLHWTLIICLCGMWYPVYKWRKRNIERTTKIYAAPQVPAAQSSSSVTEIMATPVRCTDEQRAHVEAFLDGELSRNALTFKEAMLVPDIKRERRAQVALALREV